MFGNLNKSTPVNRISLHLAIVLMLIITVSITACIPSKNRKDQTLKTLSSKAVKVAPKKMQRTAKTDARATYKEFARNTRNESLRIRAMERLADLELETQQDSKVEEVERREKAAQNLGTPIDVFQSQKQNEADYAVVARQYEDLLRRQSNPKKVEGIMYQLARAYDLSGQLELSLQTLSRLMKQFPHTRRKDEVQFRRGELYFQLKSYRAAERAYKAIIVDDDSAYYERSLYKLGWSIFKQNDLPRAIKAFYKLLDANFKSGKKYADLSRSARNLIDDTFRIVGLVFSYQQGPESIVAYSRQNGRRVYEDRIYSRLGQLYMDQERFEDAANSYAAYVELYPNDRRSPEFLVKVIDIYEKGGFAKPLTKAKGDFASRYGVHRPFWGQQDQQLFLEIAPYIKKNLIDLAKHYHSIAQSKKRPSDFKVAAHWYRDFVDSFPNEPETIEMNFLLAESLSESKNYVDAASEYEKTAYKYDRHSKSAEAGYAALLAHQKQIKALQEPEKLAKRKQAVASALRFSDNFPKDKRVPKVLLNAAEEHLELKNMPEASLVARRIADLPGKGMKKLKESAYAIIAAAEFGMGNHKKAEIATIRKLRSMPTNAKERKTHIERLAAAVYKQGEQAREKGNLPEAAEHFLRIRGLAPKSSIRVTAEYDAATVLMQLKAWDRAIPVLKAFHRDYPEHKFIANVVTQLALAYEQTEDWSHAAEMYSNIAENEMNPEQQRGLLWQAAEFYEKSGKVDKTISAYKNYIASFGEPLEQAVEARQKIADIYKKRKKTNKRNYWLNQIIKADKMPTTTERTKFLAASAALELAVPTYKRYSKVRLVQPLKKNLKKKKKLLKESVDAFTLAANYGVQEITTASTFRIAEIYNEFSKGLYASARPTGLSDEELEQYDILLEEQAYPFEEKASKLHETNAERVADGVYDDWVKQSLRALRALQPVRYSKNERSELYINSLN